MTQTIDFPLHAEHHSCGCINKEGGGIEAYLQNAGAQQLEHAHGRTLYEHLIGTKEILRRWLQPRWLQDAGAVHSVYSTDTYRKRLVGLSRRDEVRAAVGDRAERLAYLFCVLSRDDFFEAVDAHDSLPKDGMAVRLARGRQRREWLSCHEISHLLLLHMANLAEQSRGPSGGPGRWLAQVSHLGAKLDDSQTLVPPAFASFTRVATPQQEDRARECYLAGLLARDYDEAATQLSIATKTCRWIAEPRVVGAYLASRTGNFAEARLWIAEAQRTLIDLGVPWDPRLEYTDWLKLISLIADLAFERRKPASELPPLDLRCAADFFRELERALGDKTCAPAPALEVDRDPGAHRFHRYVDSLADNGSVERSRYYPGLSSKPWYDASPFTLVEDLMTHYHDIRSEILQVHGEGFHRESERIRREGSWDVLMLYERGRKNVENCNRCPITTSVVEAHNTVRTHAGLIYFSKMKSGTHIAPHRGPTNIRLRCHLGIQVPDGDCGLRVGGETRGWKEGECIIFDDYFEHEAWNHTRDDRIVLIVDVWHPDLSPMEVRLLSGLHKYAFGVTQSLTKYWAANARAVRERD
jgi:aspartate beta-hydroxylase